MATGNPDSLTPGVEGEAGWGGDGHQPLQRTIACADTFAVISFCLFITVTDQLIKEWMTR